MLAALRVHHVLFILTLTTYVVGQTVQARYGHSKLVATRFDDSSSQIRASASGFNPSNIQTPVGSEIQILFTYAFRLVFEFFSYRSTIALGLFASNNRQWSHHAYQHAVLIQKQEEEQ